jgi:hypothetical protein
MTTGESYHYHIDMISTDLDPDTKKARSTTTIKIGNYPSLYGENRSADHASKRCAEKYVEQHGGEFVRIGIGSFLVTQMDRMVSFSAYRCQEPQCKVGV